MNKNISKKTKPAAEQQPEAPKPFKIGKLHELLALTEKPILCQFTVDKQLVEVEVRRLTASEEEAVNAIKRKLVPPAIKDQKTQAIIGYDEQDAAYQQKLAEAELQTRALTIYWGWPALKQDKPDLKDIQAITEYVQGAAHDSILHIVYTHIVAGGIGLIDRVNFTSPPVSAQS